MTLFGGVVPINGITFLVFCVFAILAVGYALGRITIKGISLGSAGVFLAALVFGCLFYGDLEALFAESDIISLHCPLNEETDHLIDEKSLEKCKTGVVVINTSRGALVDAEALLNAIKSRKVGAACLDVYEEESDFFFEDFSDHIIEDDTLARLISMPNVIVTSHQAFLTEEALSNIAETTVKNIIDLTQKGKCPNELCYRGGIASDCKTGKCF